jgi:hypothetical protein
MTKVLLGKDDYLFLINDSSNELESHMTNVSTMEPWKITQYNKHINKCLVIIFPDKCIIHNNKLPDGTICIYRAALQKLKSHLKERLHDSIEYLKNIDEPYYKTDTHININGLYQVYKNSIIHFNKLFTTNVKIKELNIKMKCVEKGLSTLHLGLGDLTWPTNLGNIVLKNVSDNYYYSDDIVELYCRYKIIENNIYNMKFYDYNYNDKTNTLIDTIFSWSVVSDHIIITKNPDVTNGFKVLIFYDSFLLALLSVLMETFYEVICVKSVYNNSIIDKYNPDYVLEYRVERFLNN